MKIYLTGGNGKLGQEVLKKLPQAIPLVRKPCGLKQEVVVDFRNSAQLRKVLSDCDVLIHLAGSTKFWDSAALEEGNVMLTQHLLEALPQKAKIIFASSVAVYGKNVSGKVDETTPPNPDSAYARTKYEAERMVMTRPGSVVLRIGPLYGPQFQDYAKFLQLIKKGRMVIFGDGKNLVSFVHVADVATAIKNSLKAKAGVYVLSGESLPQQEIYAIAAKEIGAKTPTIKIPLWLALLFAYIEEKLALLTGREPFITREHINILGRNRVFDSSKAAKELKFRPRPLALGIREMTKSLLS